MGPRRCGRGKPGLVGGHPPTPRLQWGRDAVVAESCGSAGDIPRGSGSFNGAATLWSRKGVLNADVRAQRAALQWGRDAVVAERASRFVASPFISSFNGAATLWSRKAVGAVRRHHRQPSFNGAATLWSRKDEAGKYHYEGQTELQWGRDAVVAESALT